MTPLPPTRRRWRRSSRSTRSRTTTRCRWSTTFAASSERGEEPPEQAVHGLERATELAPFDEGVRMNLAIYQLNAGELAEARGNLLPLAYNPHGGPKWPRRRAAWSSGSTPGGEPPAAELLALARPVRPATMPARGRTRALAARTESGRAARACPRRRGVALS